MEILFSVVIPLYNKEKTIAKTIESVLAQVYDKFELIIVNDGSTDGSVSIIDEIKDPRIFTISKENGGVSEARNYGVAHAKHDWIYFIDADDILEPECLSVFAALIKEFSEYRFFCANYVARHPSKHDVICCSETKKGHVKQPFKAIWERKIFPRMGSMIIHREEYDKIDGFRKECTVWEDLEIVLLLLENNDIVYDPTSVFVHNLEFNELSQKIKPLHREFAYYINLKKIKNFYHKLLLLELLFRTRNKRKEIGDLDSYQLMKAKIGNNHINYFIGRVERYIHKIVS